MLCVELGDLLLDVFCYLLVRAAFDIFESKADDWVLPLVVAD